MKWIRLLLPFMLLGLALVQIGSALHWFGHDPDQGVRIGGPFRLSDRQGKPVTDADFHGRWMLLYFGYTQCPDVCPATLNAIADALRRLGPRASQVAPLFVSIDPRHDTEPVIGRYVAQFDPRIIGLTGTPAQLLRIENAYHVAAPSPTATQDDARFETLEHSSAIIVMNPSGRLAGIIPGNSSGASIAARLLGFMR